MSRGRLRIYLGASPGVGKTYAMLNEGRRRAERGTDVVVGLVETHGRKNTANQVGELEVVPRKVVAYRGTTLEEMDVDAIIARAPQLVLVDEYAHTNAAGSRNEKRWQDVERLLDAGIDVISTLNIQHLESLNDVVTRITGVPQRETVPDAMVRRAEQIELVDMAPEAIRRRMAHGNIYPADRIDAALGNYFRPGNLGALRELALLWVADRVEENLSDYLHAHGISESWETRERVIVVLSGAPGGERLIRRAARMAGRTRGELIAVHVSVDDARAPQNEDELTKQRRLVEELGGRCYETIGSDAADALAEFARREKATQVVLGATQRPRWHEAIRGSFVGRVTRVLGDIDLHIIASAGQHVEPWRPSLRGKPVRRRVILGWLLMLIGLPLLTTALIPVRAHANLSTLLLAELVLVLAIAVVGGTVVALVASLVASLLINWYFVEPYHTLTIAHPQNVVALVVFVVVAVTVGALVDYSYRRATEAGRARLEAEALARSTTSLAADPNPLPALLDQFRSTFGLTGVRLVRQGQHVDAGDTSEEPAQRLVLGGNAGEIELYGRSLSGDDHRLMAVLGDQLAIAVESQRLAAEASTAAKLAEIDSVRTGLLRAVSHDLRTPLASIKAMVSGLLDPSVRFSEGQVHEALTEVNAATDRLSRLINNLLDASRLQSGALGVDLQDAALSDVVNGALRSLDFDPASIDNEVESDAFLVRCDPVLLERAVANLVANAVAHSPAGTAVRIEAAELGDDAALRIVDRGPGIAAADRIRVTAPFQRLGDSGGVGVGLGLAITTGFVEAMGGSLHFDDTPGGGLTATIQLPLARMLVVPE